MASEQSAARAQSSSARPAGVWASARRADGNWGRERSAHTRNPRVSRHLEAIGASRTFVGIYMGIESETRVSSRVCLFILLTKGFLRWCETDFVHPQYVCSF